MRKFQWIPCFLVVSLWSLFAATGCQVGSPSCLYEGIAYLSGESIESANPECTVCICGEDGEVQCQGGCSPKAPTPELKPKACRYQGATHKHKAPFEAGDGCNTCLCEDGKVTCTAHFCATSCSRDEDVCAPGTYCRYAVGRCGKQKIEGKCQRQPKVCTDQVAHVCGCDNETYRNECYAARAGVSIRHLGRCPKADAR